eukprot:Gb_05941 [translate_table: standard]
MPCLDRAEIGRTSLISDRGGFNSNQNLVLKTFHREILPLYCIPMLIQGSSCSMAIQRYMCILPSDHRRIDSVLPVISQQTVGHYTPVRFNKQHQKPIISLAMGELDCSLDESIGSWSPMECFTPPTSQFKRVRTLQSTLTTQRSLVSTIHEKSDEELSERAGGHHTEEKKLAIYRFCLNKKIWACLEEPTQHCCDQKEGSLCSHSYIEGRYYDGCVPYVVQYQSPGVHQAFEEEHWISVAQNNQKDRDINSGSICPAPGKARRVIWRQQDLKGLEEISPSIDTYTLKPDTISCQQWRILKAISLGKSVFVTASVGTGKSRFLENAVTVLSALHGSEFVSVTASTGFAAAALNGRTLHSFAGFGLGKQPAEILASIVENNKEAAGRWRSAKALIIDEISLIDGELFDKLEYVARNIRENNKVFGGLQLLVTGDFFQLPPVKPPNPCKEFAFEADCWHKCFDLQTEMTDISSQEDMGFIGMLHEIRRGKCSPKTAVRLSNCEGPSGSSYDKGIAPTILYPKKSLVRECNDKKLSELEKITEVSYSAMDEGSAIALLHDGVTVKELHLRVKAQVMLMKNLDVKLGLVNGARGVVVGFADSHGDEFRQISSTGKWPVVQFACLRELVVLRPAVWEVRAKDVILARRTQVPLILSWALTVHQCQGLRIIGFDPSKIKAHPKVFRFYERLGHKNDEYDASPDGDVFSGGTR